MSRSKSMFHHDPDILSGAPVFVGTRVPVRSLFDYIAAGEDLEVFLEHFPSVTREQAVAVLKEVNELLVTHAAAD